MAHVRLWRLSVALAGMLAVSINVARAQDYPAKTMRIIVPLAAGGLADILARTVAQQMAATSGQTVVVENRPGGAGAIGGEAAARSPADGYTLFLGGQGSNATLPHLAKINFDPGKIAPVIHLATFPNLLVVNPALPVKTVKELVAHAKANPGKLSFASQGNGSSGHMVAEQFKDDRRHRHGARALSRCRARGAGPRRRPCAGDVRQRHAADAAARLPASRGRWR